MRALGCESPARAPPLLVRRGDGQLPPHPDPDPPSALLTPLIVFGDWDERPLKTGRERYHGGGSRTSRGRALLAGAFWLEAPAKSTANYPRHSQRWLAFTAARDPGPGAAPTVTRRCYSLALSTRGSHSRVREKSRSVVKD